MLHSHFPVHFDLSVHSDLFVHSDVCPRRRSTLCSEHRPTQKQLIGKRRQRWCQETSLCSSSSSLSPSASPSSSMHASSDVCTSAMSSQACPYCMEPVGDINSYDVLLGPCCKRGIYHRECLQVGVVCMLGGGGGGGEKMWGVLGGSIANRVIFPKFLLNLSLPPPPPLSSGETRMTSHGRSKTRVCVCVCGVCVCVCVPMACWKALKTGYNGRDGRMAILGDRE